MSTAHDGWIAFLRRGLSALALAVALVAWSSVSVAAGVEDDGARLLSVGESAFDRGLSLAEKDREAANALFREAAAAWCALRDERGVHNPRLEFNIGNAWSLSGDQGRAIAAYRRAAALDPRDATIREGLEAARKRAGVPAPTAQPRTIGERAMDLYRRSLEAVPAPTRLMAAGALYVLGWMAIAWRVWRGRPGLLGWAFAAWGIALFVGAGPVLDSWQSRTSPQGVVVAREVTARTGPSDGVYEAAFQEPLRAGLEVRVRERRQEWLRVALPEGREAWVPATAVEMIERGAM